MVPLTVADEAIAIGILSRAFASDPLGSWISADSRFPQLLNEMGIPPFLRDGICYMTAEHNGAALWMGPDKRVEWPSTLSYLFRFLRVAGVRGIYRFLYLEKTCARLHPREPHYYLFELGVLPEAAGQGVGSALIQHMLNRCDSERVPAYLENSNERNLPFYQRHGFEVLEEVRLPGNGPSMWSMWRTPRVS